MNALLWILQIVLALLYISGGGYKTFNANELLTMGVPFSKGTWMALGVLEMAGGLLLVVPAATKWMPSLTPIAAGVLTAETLILAWIYSRYSTAFTVENPMPWALVMGVLAIVATIGTYMRYGK